MAADVTIKGCKLCIISCYAPTLDKPLNSKLVFYRELKRLTETEKNRKVLIQGDFNAEPDLCRRHSSFDGGSNTVIDEVNQTNENINKCSTLIVADSTIRNISLSQLKENVSEEGGSWFVFYGNSTWIC